MAEFQRLAQAVTFNVQKLTNQLAQMETCVNQLGTPQDGDNVRTQLHQLQQSCNSIAQQTSGQLRNVQGSVTTPQQKNQVIQLRDSFSSTMNRLQSLQRAAVDKERASYERARAHSSVVGEDEDAWPQASEAARQEQAKLQFEAEVNLEQLKEREKAMRQLESNITDCNQIFKDLAVLVHEQGETIDSIHGYIEDTAVRVEQANVQLDQATKYQSSANKKKLCCGVIIFTILAVVGLAIGLSVAAN